MVKDGDESHGIRIPKKSPKKQLQPKSLPFKGWWNRAACGTKKIRWWFRSRDLHVDQQQQQQQTWRERSSMCVFRRFFQVYVFVFCERTLWLIHSEVGFIGKRSIIEVLVTSSFPTKNPKNLKTLTRLKGAVLIDWSS